MGQVTTVEKAVSCHRATLDRVRAALNALADDDALDMIEALDAVDPTSRQGVPPGTPRSVAGGMIDGFLSSLEGRFTTCLTPLRQSTIRRKCVRYALPPVE